MQDIKEVSKIRFNIQTSLIQFWGTQKQNTGAMLLQILGRSLTLGGQTVLVPQYQYESQFTQNFALWGNVIDIFS